jgi:repressor LexA
MATATEVEPRPLTEKQAAVFRFIYETARDRGYQPSFREIGERFGIGGTNGVMCHVTALARKGWISPRPAGHGSGPSRAIVFLRRPTGEPFCGFSDKEC